MADDDILNLSDWFLGRRIAAGDGERRALLTPDGSPTYAEVDGAAGRVATALRERDALPGAPVFLSLPDGPDFVAALFGIVRMGGVAVMLNPELPADRLAELFRYARAHHAFIDPSLHDTWESAAALVDAPPVAVPVDDAFRAELGSLEPLREGHPTAPDDPAIWLFSGGTTGRPKAVVQTHRSFVNTTRRYGHGVLEMRPDDVTLSVPKLYFGYATGTGLLFPFSVGATAALFPERCTAEALFDRIEQFRPTVLVNVPTMVNRMLAHPGGADRDLSSLRVATSAGEALPPELHRRWDDTWGVPLLDGLGTAEMWHIFVSNRLDDVRPGTLGRVVPGFEVRACDDDGEPVPAGEAGRMWVKGDSLGLGYWQEPDRTAEAFRGDWFVSGDMIRIDEDGYVTYCGRADDMLKVSGKWLAPRELEDCLISHDLVREAAVVGATTTDGLVKPHAFVVLAADREGTPRIAEELQEWARDRLEPYKYPREITFLDDFPRTHLGKVDRGALARMAGGRE